jgi:hypothetical protein
VNRRITGWEIVDTSGSRAISEGAESNRITESCLSDCRRTNEQVMCLEWLNRRGLSRR